MTPTDDLHDYSTFQGKVKWLISRARWTHILAAIGAVALVTALTFIGAVLVTSDPENDPTQNLMQSAGNVLRSTGDMPASGGILRAEPTSTEEKLVLIDTDAGIDDAWAFFLCLAAHKNPDIPFRIVGITTNFGNTGVDNVVVNVGRILQVADELEIPVYRGSETALVLPLNINYTRFIGLDGFGDTGLPKVQPNLSPDHAALGIIKLVEEYKNRLNILAIGPVTNLATALRLKPAIRTMIKGITIMGGNYQGKQGGNTRADFNFLSDVEAAHVVLGNFAPTPVTLVPREAGIQGKVDCVYRQSTLGTVGTAAVALLNRIEAFSLKKCTMYWYAPDAVAACALIEPRFSLQRETIKATVELRGDERGQVRVLEGVTKKASNSATVQVTTVIDLELFQRMLLWAAGGPSYMENQQ